MFPMDYPQSGYLESGDKLEELIVDYDFLRQFKIGEVFVSTSKKTIMDIFEKSSRSFSSCHSGTSVRSYDPAIHRGRLLLYHGVTNGNLSRFTPQENSIPYAKLPTLDVNGQPFSELESIIISDELPKGYFQRFYESFQSKGFVLERITLERTFSRYIISNTYNVKGCGYKIATSPAFFLSNLSQEKLVYTKVFPSGRLVESSDELFNLIDIDNNKKKITCQNFNCNYLLLSPRAVGELLYKFLCFLNDQAIKYGTTLITTNIKNLDNIFKFSGNFTLVENSTKNKTVGGSSDGEGTHRVPNYIFLDGKFVKLLSSYFNGTCENVSGSGYRFEYSVLPQTKATKTEMISGDLTTSEIIQSVGNIAYIDSFQGLYESFDKNSFLFTSLLNLKIYEKGEYTGNQLIKAHIGLIDILSNIEIISKNCEYFCDGSLISPGVVIPMDLLKVL